jgi:SAM-dependent methyltransferase
MIYRRKDGKQTAGVALWNKRWHGRKEKTSIDLETDPIYRLLEYFVPQPHSSIIEIGCGTGLRTLHFAKQYGLETTLFDYSDVALELAAENARNLGVSANTINGDLLNNSLASDRYDIVWSAGLHEHFRGEDRQRAFNEMYRICKPGGICIIIVPNSLNPPYRLIKRFKEMLGTWPFGDEYPFTRWELSDRLHRSGFNGVKTVGIGALLSIYRWFLLDLRYANKLLKNPTPFASLNGLLQRIDLDISTANYLNNLFGREVGALGTK